MKLLKITSYFFLVAILFTACRKEYSLEGGNLKLPTGTWEFNDSLKQFQGDMDTAYVESPAGTTTKVLHLIGTSLDGTQSFQMNLYADTFKTGTYKASLFQSSFNYATSAKTIYQADQLVGEFIVTVTSYTDNFISGTFSGAALDSGNALKHLSQGKFSSSLTISGNGTSTGVLGDSSGNCKPVTIAGTYAPGAALTAANTVQVQVTVAEAGTYSITSNKVNGVTFSKTGSFTATGPQTVQLTGSGTPTNGGDQTFIIHYGFSQCAFVVNFGTPASGVLGAGGGNCTPFTIAGVYRQSVALTSSNTVQIQVNVATAGSYNIITNTLNGVTFSKSGTFTATGVQTILLTGSGTPTNAGLQTFTVSFGTSTCSFNVTFLTGVMPSNDYFPLTTNSNWTFSLAGGTSSDDVLLTVIGYTPTLNGKAYNTIEAHSVPFTGQASDSAFYRKPGGDYYQYIDYSNVLQFDNPVVGEFIFLKDNVPVNTTWTSPTVSGTLGTIPVTGFIKMTILEKAVPVTIGGFNFPDVIKVQYEYFLTGDPVAVETDERWFAKNQGEIHDSFNDGFTTITYDVSTFQVK